MILARHAMALLVKMAGRPQDKDSIRTADEAIDILADIAEGKRKMMTPEQAQLLVDLLDYDTTDDGMVANVLGAMLTARGMDDDAMNAERMELYVTLRDIAGEQQ